MDDHDDDEDTVVGNCLHCNAPPPPRSSEDSDPDSAAATRVQVSCDDCRSFICDGCHWCHEFQANHEIRVCDRCDAFYCRGCDEMDQCEDCSEVVCNTCSTLMSCKFCGCGLCEDCATACGRCGIVLCARDAKFAVECDTCKMSYCLVCLASGTKDPCVRCGHRPSKRVEQLVHLRLKSIYKAFKQSGASVGPESSPGAGGGGSHSGTGACNHSSSAVNNKAGRDASTISGKYSSTLRSLAENDSAGTPNSESKDKIGSFDQSMANEVAAVLQTASNAMTSADGDTADRRSRGKRVSSHSSSHDHGQSTGGRNRARANSASERYYRKTQAELEAAAAAAEADAEAAAAALLAELDEEDASAVSKKKKKKKKKEKKKEPIPEPEQSKPKSIAENDASSPSQRKKTDKKITAAKNTGRESDEDSSEDEINFEQLVGRTKGSAKATKKKDRQEADVEEKVTAAPIISKPKVVEPAPPTETSTDFDKELAILLSSDDELGLESFLDKLRGVPGLGAARKTAKKALKRIKEAKEPALVENDEPSSENKMGGISLRSTMRISVVPVAFGAGFALSYVSLQKPLMIKENLQQHDLDNTKPVLREAAQTAIKRPFEMPLEGEKYRIFQPLFDNPTELGKQLFGSPAAFIASFSKRVSWVNTMITNPPGVDDDEFARSIYLEMIKSFVSATVYGDTEQSVGPAVNTPKHSIKPLNTEKRKGGEDWTYLGETMTGHKRLDNVRNLLTDVFKKNVSGGYIETGVWRGGSSMFARAVITAFGEAENRVSYVCDSFAGLPPGDRSLDSKDKFWDNTPYLEVTSEIVAESFMKYGLLDDNVVFAKGFFNETMQPLSQHIKDISIMRLDGDMYESTVDVLYHLYDKLSIGGYVIMDDWFGFPSKTACQDFFAAHDINPEIIPIDSIAAYWQKTEKVDVQFWRYQQNKFKASDTQ